MSAIDDAEEARALAYRESLTAQRAYRRAQALLLLVDDTGPYEQLIEDWQPLIDAIRESKNNDRTEEKPRTTVWKRV